MNLPQGVKVGPYSFSISTFPADDREDVHGYCLTTSRVIKVADTIKGALLVDTVIHEILHAIYWSAGLREGDDEERIVSLLATGWTQVLIDSPSVRKWLSAESARLQEGGGSKVENLSDRRQKQR